MVRRKRVEESAAQALAEVVGASPSRWIERGEAQELPFEYLEEAGELEVELPAMSGDVADTGRWSLTFTWPLTPERSRGPPATTTASK
jgi:hypothetical protein